ncbi:hypothetical protein [Allorhizobium taibaishanense]|uniref:Uncharacterized protein n=1 Tax=Allorhizobium taibaishanense TaxID=887144 RepID=A0A1Q9A2M9_9HYPH|nr:hypothetical protein [Allorhizobium taibaishanense]MBB4005785.1 hypothetical protein [Allorhizobium taibaishanense]OLP48834.1 hypothetical protein BJF91_17010 [Allorhizobium taibaishanense]
MSKVQSKDAFLYDLAGDTGVLKTALREAMELGSAADEDAAAFASSAQGAKADSAVQPEDLATTADNGLMTAADKVKLNGIANGATANATDAALRDRTTHTGEQPMSTVTGLIAALAAKATPADISAAITALVNSSPAAMDTLNELAAALGNDPNFAATTATALGNRVRYDAAQSLTSTQKDQALANIGAASQAAQAATAATVASVVTIIRSPLKVSLYCLGDGTNEDTKFSQFFAELQDKGVDGVIDIPVRLASSKTLSGYMATLRAAGAGRLIFSGGTDGLVIDNSAVASGFVNTFGIDGLGLYTETDGVGVGLRFVGSDYIADNLVRSLHFERLRLYGVETNKGWSKGGVIKRAVGSVINSIYVRGRSSLAANDLQVGVEFSDGCNTVDLNNPYVTWGELGILVKNEGRPTEAIRINSGSILAMRQGFVALSPGQYHVAKGVHFDTTRIGVSLGADSVNGSDFSSVEDCFFLRSEAELYSALQYVSIILNCNYAAARGNRIHISGETDANGVSRQNNSYGIVVGSITDTTKIGRATVSDNGVSGAAIPVNLRNNTTGCDVTDNRIDAYGNVNMTSGGILDQGADNNTGNNTVIDAGNVVTRNIGAAKAIPSSEGYTSATLSNITGDGSASGINPLAITLNLGGGLASNGTFTAPVSGEYQVDVNVQLADFSGATSGIITIVAGPSTAMVAFRYGINPVTGFGHAGGSFHLKKGEQLYATCTISGTTKVVDIVGGSANTTRLKIVLVRAD